MPPKHNSQRVDDLLASVTEDLLMGAPQRFEETSLRVERILLEIVRPDPIQPRRVLPENLHFAFHDHHLTPTEHASPRHLLTTRCGCGTRSPVRRWPC